MEAVVGKLLGGDVIPELAGLRDLRQQVSEQVDELLLRLGDVLVSWLRSSEIS